MANLRSISRRDFVKLVTASVATAIATVLGLPLIRYLIDPALKEQGSSNWIPLGRLEAFEIGKPTLVNFTRTRRRGWEKTVSSYAVYVERRAEPEVVVFSSRCTHLACRVNWREEKQEYICPCHNGRFGREGEVLGGPPPRPLERYDQSRLKIENGVLYFYFQESS